VVGETDRHTRIMEAYRQMMETTLHLRRAKTGNGLRVPDASRDEPLSTEETDEVQNFVAALKETRFCPVTGKMEAKAASHLIN